MSDSALKNFTYGIYFLGTRSGDKVNAMVASWVTQVSFSPKLIAVGVKKERYSHVLLEEGGVFSICVLGTHFKDKLALFKGNKSFGENNISGYEYDILETGAPILKDCLGFVECRVVQAIETGDHTLFIGEVVNERFKSGDPLISAHLNGHFYGG